MTALKFLKEQQKRHRNMAESMKVAYFDDELDEAIEELEKLENKSCEGCIHKNENEVMDYDCFECSRYYTDRYKPKDKQ